MNIHAANRHLREARVNLAQAESVLAGAIAREGAKKQEVETALAAEAESSDESTALQRAAARRDAEIIADAASRATAFARRAQATAAAEVHDAQHATRQAAYAIIAGEGVELAREIARDTSALEAKKAKLATLRELPGFEPGPEIAIAIGDAIHMRVCDMAPPANLSIPVNQIGRVQNSEDAARYWNDRVAQLLSDKEPPAQDAAAA